MHHTPRLIVAGIAALALAAPSSAFAQTTTQTQATPTSTSAPGNPSTPSTGSTQTAAPETAAPATAAPSSTTAPAPANTGSSATPQPHKANALQKLSKSALKKLIKPVASATLTDAQVQYAMTHQAESAQKLQSMKTVSFKKLRVYHLTAAQKAKYKVAELGAPVQLAELNSDFLLAQTGGTVLNQLHNVLANVNVSDALNNVLNNSNVNLNANVSLQDVLNNVNVGVGQVVGIYIGTGGSVTTIAG